MQKKLQIFVNFCLKWQKTKTLVHTTMARPLCTMMDPSCRKSWDCSWFVYIQPNLEAGENNGLSPRILLRAGTYLVCSLSNCCFCQVSMLPVQTSWRKKNKKQLQFWPKNRRLWDVISFQNSLELRPLLIEKVLEFSSSFAIWCASWSVRS